MLELLRKFVPGNYPFESMTGVRRLTMTPGQYRFFVERLVWGLTKEKEDGGLVTAFRHGETAGINEIYPLPDEFKSSNHVNMYTALESPWFQALFEELKDKRQKIGFYYHTHPKVQRFGSEIHEEGCTARRTRNDGIEKLLEHDKTMGLTKVIDYGRR